MLLCSLLVAAVYILLACDNSDLAKVHAEIQREFAQVSHIDGDDLLILGQDGILLFDVREPSEYAVSHLKDAIQVDPRISVRDFTEKFSDISRGKTVIFYCSVGQRSSDLADRTQGALMSSGAKAVYNLRGGIFRWHNERRQLYTGGAKPTEYVHPYNPIWGRMVEDQKHARY